ncbi:MAG: hypothetical protein ACKVOM_09535 [Ferruginibacter sp.]
MFKKLQNKWKVGAARLLLIIATFAIGGSLCGYAGRRIMEITNIEKGVLWVLLYIILVTILWPLAVMIVSLPLGQYFFFSRYLGRMYHRIKGRKPSSATSKKQLL